MERVLLPCVMFAAAAMLFIPAPASAAVDLDRSLDLSLDFEIIPAPRPNSRDPNPVLYQSFPYRLFLPPGLEETDRSFPLVLFLHGSGERGDNNLSQVINHIDGLVEATQSERFSAYLLAPQLPLPGGRIINENPDLPQTSNELYKMIMDVVLSDHRVDPNRIYVTGLSLGGFGTFDLIAEFPELFAAAAPLSGGGNTATADRIKDVPMWIFHGRTDTVVPYELSQAMFDAVTAAGGSPMLSEIPTPGHGGWDGIYRDAQDQLYPWMFSQSLPEPASLGVLACGAVAMMWRRGNH